MGRRLIVQGSIAVGQYLLDMQFLYIGEAVLVVIACGVALLWPAARPAPFGGLEASIARLAQQPWKAALVVLVLAVGLRALVLPVLGPPVPWFPDEFSMVLQGQTFALGRLTNPTHPLYPFFETAYVGQVPAYASMYFPGRGAPLALGLVLAGNAWVGVWISMVMLSVATFWALRGWVSPGLALVGALMLVCRFDVVSGWINSYYGGGIIALGGMLILGAYPRLMAAAQWRDGIALGMGLLLLMISRPFEGLFFSLPFLAVGAWKLLGQVRHREFAPAARMAIPTILLCGIGATLVLAYNAAATGNMLLDPYTFNRQTYAYWPAFLIGAPFHPHNHVPVQLDGLYWDEGFIYLYQDNLASVLQLVVAKFKRVLNFYIGPVFLIPFVIGAFRGVRHPILLVSGGLLMACFLLVSWNWSQYLAAGTGTFFILIMMGLSALRGWQFRGRPSGLVLARLLPCIVALSVALPMLGLFAGKPDINPQSFIRPCCAILTDTPRSKIMQQLEASPGRDLVIYRADPAEPRRWVTMVANEPDIDKSQVVWAHDLGPLNKRLLDYYPDRKVWIVNGQRTDQAIPVTDRGEFLRHPAKIPTQLVHPDLSNPNN